MTERNGSPTHGSTKRLTLDSEQARIDKLCAGRGLDPPILSYEGLRAVWPDLDLGLLVVERSTRQAMRAANRAAGDGWLVVWATQEQWQSGEALDAVAKAVKALTDG